MNRSEQGAVGRVHGLKMTVTARATRGKVPGAHLLVCSQAAGQLDVRVLLD